MLDFLKSLFSFEHKTKFTAFTYVDDASGKPLPAPQEVGRCIHWLPPVITQGGSYEERERRAFKELREQNRLLEGQVWIYETQRA